MAEIVLNPDIANLDTDSKLEARKRIYQTLLDGMKKANEGTPPDYNAAPYSKPQEDANGNPMYWDDPDGNHIQLMVPDQAEIQKKMDEISSIQMKNAAYLFAQVIDGAASSAAAGFDTTAFVQKSGDSMTGSFSALYGFEAGTGGQKVFDVIKDVNNEYIAHVYGSLIVDNDVTVGGQINVSDTGIWFAQHQSIFYADNALQINNEHIKITGDIVVDGSFTLGDVIINNKGLFWGTKEFYHSGNSNLSTVDWSMKDGHVYGDLTVDGSAVYNGRFKALNGFDLGEKGNVMLSSVFDDATNRTSLDMKTDLNITPGYGVMFDGKYIIQVRDGASNIVSFSAPGRIMNLGDSSGEDPNKIPTQFISLQADLYDSTHTRKLVSFDGAGNFPNGFSAGVANSGDWAMRTYTHSSDDYGVVFHRKIALGNEYGPKLSAEDNDETLYFDLPYTHSNDSGSVVDHLGIKWKFGPSNSLWHYPPNDVTTDISLHIDTDGEFIIFDKPVEAKTFSINSLKYKTQLKENALFLREGIFIEGVNDGMAFTGNAYFNNNVQSQRFASGFAGYGWGIIKSEFAGGYHATFDELTVRKRMRIYELEVQKLGATNGSLWVSDSCSGDLVEEISEAY